MIAALDEKLAQVAAHKAGAARDEHAVLAAPRLGLDQRLGAAAAALLLGWWWGALISLCCSARRRVRRASRSACSAKQGGNISR
jgi:hypothetical protein